MRAAAELYRRQAELARGRDLSEGDWTCGGLSPRRAESMRSLAGGGAAGSAGAYTF